MKREMCRLCLNECNLSPMFVELEQSERYSAVLTLTTGLKIEPNDGLPQQICENCTELVNSALKLRNQCHLSQIKLLQLEFIDKHPGNNKNESGKTKETCSKSSDKELRYEINKGGVDAHSCELLDFHVEVEFQRVTDDEIGGKTQKQDGGSGENNPIKKMTRKDRRNMYLELVEGVFDPKGPVKCKVCKKTVSKWSCFISHAKVHLGFKFMCEFCGKSFISSTQLKRHCRSHHGMQRDLACRHCSYLALDKPQLVLHERRMHTGERPFVCDICAASYFSRRCLVQHLESHRTNATVQCELCPQKFKSSRHLARHRYSAHARRRTKKANSNEPLS